MLGKRGTSIGADRSLFRLNVQELFDPLHSNESGGDRRDSARLTGLILALASMLASSGPVAAQDQGDSISVLRSTSVSYVAGASSFVADSTSGDSAAVIRMGGVALETGFFSPSAANRQGAAVNLPTLGVEFFPDVYVDISVTSESNSSNQVMSLNGKADGMDIATFSMTVTPDTYLISFRDLQSTSLYRVIGDTETGVGKVTEYDLSKLPEAIHSPPLTPGLE